MRTELELAGHPGRSRPELLDAITSAADETDRLTQLAEELLLLARSDDHRHTHYEVEPLTPLLHRAVQTFQPRADAQRVTLNVTADADVDANVDASDLRRAVENLLDNALRYAPADSTVEVRLRRDGRDAVIEVLDSGPGFPPEFLPHAFERFRRADNARARAEGGTGLGLAIVRAVAQHHGGSATATNRRATGAIVVLSLPVGTDVSG